MADDLICFCETLITLSSFALSDTVSNTGVPMVAEDSSETKLDHFAIFE